MTHALPTLLIAWAGLATLMAVTFFAARRLDNYGIVDAVWAWSFTPLVLWFATALPGAPARRLLLGALVALWSLRLGTHLARRIAAAHPREDRRYAALRTAWGPRLAVRMAGFFQLQALSVLVLAAPLFLAAADPAPRLGLPEIAGAILCLLALAGESVADFQLRRFQRRAAGARAVCRDGLWRYSRHPNYFFEWLVWVGFAVFALGSPFGGLGLIAPALMFHLLRHVTGVPPTEAASLAARGDAYRAYQQSTNAFFPGPPRPAPTTAR